MIKIFKKGQSLVEVVVALSLVTIVFSSTVTLIVGAYNLAMSSRNSTEAIAISQKIMTDLIEGSREDCTRKEIDDPSGTYPSQYSDDLNYKITKKSKGAKLEIIDGREVVTFEPDFDSAKYAKFTVTINWDFRNKGYDYEISQVVQK